MIAPGDVVYFKVCTKESKRRARQIGFKGGQGFGVMLGIVPPFGGDPSATQLFSLMGQVGFLSFDNVVEFLGVDQAKICIAKFEEKYHPPKVPQSKLILPETKNEEIKGE